MIKIDNLRFCKPCRLHIKFKNSESGYFAFSRKGVFSNSELTKANPTIFSAKSLRQLNFMDGQEPISRLVQTIQTTVRGCSTANYR